MNLNHPLTDQDLAKNILALVMCPVGSEPIQIKSIVQDLMTSLTLILFKINKTYHEEAAYLLRSLQITLSKTSVIKLARNRIIRISSTFKNRRCSSINLIKIWLITFLTTKNRKALTLLSEMIAGTPTKKKMKLCKLSRWTRTIKAQAWAPLQIITSKMLVRPRVSAGPKGASS